MFWHRKNRSPLTPAQRKWNQLWELWAQGQVPSPFGELMTYQGEVSNGGHGQYFENIGAGDLPQLERLLPPALYANALRACHAYQAGDDAILDRCDALFSKLEEEVSGILQEYAVCLQ